MRVIDGRGLGDCRAVLPRAGFDVDQAVAVVAPVCQSVRDEGEAALRRWSARYDGVVPDSFRVDPEWMANRWRQLDPGLADAMVVAIERRRRVAQAELMADSTVELAPGATVTIRSVPIERVGLYVPGGVAPLASSVIMNVVAAQVAGVGSIALASPPQAEFGGRPHPTIAALAHHLGVHEVYAVGGAQAIAMLAYGVPGLCVPVDLITGPGNIYVVAAKRLVSSVVGIDTEAGPTEVAIVADATAQPRLVAADLLSQAEHDTKAAAVLITADPGLIEAVQVELANQLAELPDPVRASAALAGEQSAIVRVSDLAQAVAVANQYAAEHLEIMTADPAGLARQISQAGAIFLGDTAPVSLGDYAAGSTHVLPTRAAGRHSSGLTARSFLKTVHVVDYSAAALAEIADAVETFALAERLPAHARAITVRTDHAA